MDGFFEEIDQCSAGDDLNPVILFGGKMENSKESSYSHDTSNVSRQQEKMKQNLAEIEKYINTYQKYGGEFRFPDEFVNLALEDPENDEYGLYSSDGFEEFVLFFDKEFYEYHMEDLDKKYRKVDYVPFARQYDSSNIVCFYLDNRKNKQIIVINPFWPNQPHIKSIYEDFSAWCQSITRS